MKKLVAAAAVLLVVLLVGSVPTANAGSQGSDHMLIDASAGEHGYCGVGKKIEPWDLNISYSPGSSPGTLTVGFRDTSTVSFPVASNTSFSLTQAMGGVPGVDDLVRIDISTGAAWVSAKARSGARDPFTEPVAERDNFCINIPAEQASDTVGVTLPGPLPVGWDEGIVGKLD